MLPRVLIGPLLALMVLACAAPAANAAEVPSEWSWTDYGPSLRDVSCASPGHCVAVGQRGMVLYSKHAGDDGLAWSRIPGIEFPEELDGVTCTTGFCLAVSNTREGSATFTSQVFRSTDGGASWTAGVPLPPADAGPGGAKTRTAIALSCAGDGPPVTRSGPAAGSGAPPTAAPRGPPSTRRPAKPPTTTSTARAPGSAWRPAAMTSATAP